jgi:hypothetical protein
LLTTNDAKVKAPEKRSRMVIDYFRLYAFVNVCKRIMWLFHPE